MDLTCMLRSSGIILLDSTRGQHPDVIYIITHLRREHVPAELNTLVTRTGTMTGVIFTHSNRRTYESNIDIQFT